MKKLLLSLGLLCAGWSPAWAVNYGRAYLPASSCHCYGPACTPKLTTDLNLGGLPAKPIFEWTDSDSASVQCEFWFPISHDPANTTFYVTVEYLKDGTIGFPTTDKYCYSFGYAVLPDNPDAFKTWSGVIGNEGPAPVTRSCSNPQAGIYRKESCSSAVGVTAFDTAAAGSCTYNACAGVGAATPSGYTGNPGMLFIQRIHSSDAACSGSANLKMYPIGFTVEWPIP